MSIQEWAEGEVRGESDMSHHMVKSDPGVLNFRRGGVCETHSKCTIFSVRLPLPDDQSETLTVTEPARTDHAQ